MTEYTLKEKVLNIGMNLTRVGNWVMDYSTIKGKRINQFIFETNILLNELSESDVGAKFEPTLIWFKKEFSEVLKRLPLVSEGKTDNLELAEKLFTLASILTHRAILVSN